MPHSIAVSRALDPTTSIARTFGVVNAFLERDPTGEIITAVRRFPAREAQWADFPGWLHADLVAAYAAKGVRRPYTHQADAAETMHSGKNVVIVTPTASCQTPP
jgi:DEAD/DEAH box helicase domain-containing protein